MKKRRILFLTDNFPPETNAPATRSQEHIDVWIEKGMAVDVVTSVPNFPKGKIYPGYRNKLYQRSNQNDFTLHRVWTFISENSGVIKRSLDYISFCISSFIAGLFIRTDIIVATSPQFFTAISGYLLSVFKRKPWIFEVRDLWPESIVAVGAIRNVTVIEILTAIEMWLYRKADRIVVVTEAFRNILIERGITSQKIDVIPNGVTADFFSRKTGESGLRKSLGLEDSFIIGYLGTHGMAHGLDFVLKAAKKLLHTNVHFLFIGDGAEKEKLLALGDQLGLTNVTFLPPVEKSQVCAHLSAFDVALVSLRRSDTFKSVIPSKIFEYAAVGLPILLGVEGESKALVEKYKCGKSYRPEDEKQFLDAINELLGTGVDYKDMEEGAIRLSEQFDRRKMAEKYIDVFNKMD